jgi:site-specific recombinase XerC
MSGRTLTVVTENTAPAPELDRLLDSWLRHLRGQKQPATIRAYRYAVAGLSDLLATSGMPTDPRWITSEHIDLYLDHEMSTNSPTTAKLRRSYLSVFFRWLVDEDEIDANPVRRSKVPAVEDRPNDVVTDDDWQRLLDATKGRDLIDKRDHAILRVFESSGMRRTEVAALTIGQIDLDNLIIKNVRVKGNRREVRVIDEATAAAVDRYLRARRDDIAPERPLWLGRNGRALSSDGIAEVMRRRGAEAGVSGLHAHAFRHRWAEFGKATMSDENLMALGGWRSPTMLAKYARATTTTRAIAEYRKAREGR